MATLLPALTSGRVLDIGCGDGLFLPAGAIGLDVDMDRLAAARSHSRLVVCADARRLPFTGAAFDTAYAHRMLNDTGDVDRALDEIARVLRPGGRLLVFTRARPAAGDRLDRANGADRLERYFSDVSVQTHPIDERAALLIADRPRVRAAGAARR